MFIACSAHSGKARSDAAAPTIVFDVSASERHVRDAAHDRKRHLRKLQVKASIERAPLFCYDK
jgi:hypothetical protein